MKYLQDLLCPSYKIPQVATTIVGVLVKFSIVIFFYKLGKITIVLKLKPVTIFRFFQLIIVIIEIAILWPVNLFLAALSHHK